MKISAVILTKGEESLDKAIDSVKFADEVIVIADNVDIKNPGVKVFKRKLNGDFAAQRNFGFKKSRGDWVLFIDADEIVSKELKEEILRQVHTERGRSAYYIKRRDWFWGRELRYGEILEARSKGFIRLVGKNSGHWRSPVHETFETSDRVGKLDSYLEHYPHQTIKEFLEHVNFYSTLRARELLKTRKSISIFEIILWPLLKFKVNYFLKLGFLDGPAGFVYAFMMSFHSFLVRTKLSQYLYLD